MASMATRYGPLVAVRNAAIASCLVFMCSAAPAAPVKLLILGDSLASGYGLAQPESFQGQLADRLRAEGRKVDLVDAAVSGDTTAGGRARLDWAIGNGVDAALVELGGNDGLRGIDPKDTEANLAAILDTLAGRHIPVLLSGMLAPPNFGASYGNAFRAVFARLGRRPGVIYDPFFLQGVARDPTLTQADGIHPNAHGVRIEVDRMLPLVNRLLDEVPS